MFDALTLAALVDELQETLEGARVQRVALQNTLTLVMEVYAPPRRRWLLASAESEDARLLLLEREPATDSALVTPFLLLLRKYVRAGRIVAVTQPRHERIVRLTFSKLFLPDVDEDADGAGDALGELVSTELVIELMGRHSNLILLNEHGRVMDSAKRVPSARSRVRPILPNVAYQPPPAQQKRDPLATSGVEITPRLASSQEPLNRWLVRELVSVSPQLAREIAARAEIDPGNPVNELTGNEVAALQGALHDVFAPLLTGAWEPHLYHDDESGAATFSAIRLRSFESMPNVRSERLPSVLHAAERAFAAQELDEGRGDRHRPRREQLVAEIDGAIGRVEQRLRSLDEQLQRADSLARLRTSGELIYAYQWLIAPGATLLETPEGERISLDPTLDVSGNAQRYFDEYRRARSAAQTLPELSRKTQLELDYLRQLRSFASQARSYDEIEALRLEWQESGQRRESGHKRESVARPTRAAREPRRFRTSTGDVLLLGRTARQNARITFEDARPEDLWLHAREMPGAHVILKVGNGRPDELVELAAALAAYYSDGRGATRVPVDVTERRHVRRIPGAGPGMVTYRNERTIQARPRSEEELGLSSSR